MKRLLVILVLSLVLGGVSTQAFVLGGNRMICTSDAGWFWNNWNMCWGSFTWDVWHIIVGWDD